MKMKLGLIVATVAALGASAYFLLGSNGTAQAASNSCLGVEIEKTCCPAFCEKTGSDRDKAFDGCVVGMGCAKKKGEGWRTCNNKCKK